MARKAVQQQATTISCSFCLETVSIAEYPEHIKKHVIAAAQPAPAPVSTPQPAVTETVSAPQPATAAPVPYQPPQPQFIPNGQQEPVTAPPPQAPRNPWVNAQVLYANGGKIICRIVGVRSAAGVVSKTRPDINNNRKGWIIDVVTDTPVTAAAKGPNGQLVSVTTNALCGRINEGDLRHQALYGKYQGSWVGRQIVMRLPMPTENTKAGWLVE